MVAGFSAAVMGLSLYKVLGYIRQQGGFRQSLHGDKVTLTRLVLFESK